MNTPLNARRDLLKLSTIGFVAAAASVPALAAPTAATAKKAVFDVRDYGATGNGKTLDTVAINRAIEAAAAAGGGQVLFPAGVYNCFSIHLKSNVDLYLSQGATILAAASPLPNQTTGEQGGTYDAAEPKTAYDQYQDYGHNHWHNSLIWGEDIHDFSIIGPGLIWGKGLSYGADRDPRGDYPRYKAEQPGVGNKAIALKNCRNVILRDFSLLKGGHFGLLLTGVDNLTIDNLKIDTDRDGMDIDCCQNVRVSNCTVNSPWDDGICPKSSFALGYARPTRNVTITNCWVTGCYELGSVLNGTFKKFAIGEGTKVFGTGRIKCGTESNGGFINITISNCVFEGCQGLALETVDGALLEDVTVTNITMRDIISAPLFLRLGARLRGPQESTKVGTLKRVLISNLTCYNSASKICSEIMGIPNYPIEDLKLDSIYVEHQGGGTEATAKIEPKEMENAYPEPGMFGAMPAHGFYFRHVRRVEMSHTEIRPMAADARPAILLDDVERADFFSVTAPTKPAAFRLQQAKDVRVLLSRAAADQHIDTATERSF